MPRQVIPTSAQPSFLGEPLGADEFAELMKLFRFAPGEKFALAISGGPDSMALTCCVARWVAPQGSSVQAFLVDHRLRPESSLEAEEVQKRLAAFGLKSEILRWEHEPIVTRLHASARKARYRLLIEACRRHNIKTLMFAHQREDQAETILMRLAKGSGIDGLAGMRQETTLEELRLWRPFLNIPKERLIATCRAEKISFIEDVGNRSDKFARGRLRKVMPLLAQEGLTSERLIDLGVRAAEAKDALDHYTDIFLRDMSCRDEAGVVCIDREGLRKAPRAIAGRALTLGLQEVHRTDYAPEYASLMQLLEASCAAGEMASRTLHGCLVSQRGQQVVLMREFAAITEVLPLCPGESVTWDGRWRVTLAHKGQGNFVIRPLGNPPHEVVDALAPDLRKLVPRGRARASLPALWDENKLVVIPSFIDTSLVHAQLVSAWPPG